MYAIILCQVITERVLNNWRPFSPITQTITRELLGVPSEFKCSVEFYSTLHVQYRIILAHVTTHVNHNKSLCSSHTSWRRQRVYAVVYACIRAHALHRPYTWHNFTHTYARTYAQKFKPAELSRLALIPMKCVCEGHTQPTRQNGGRKCP